MTRHQRLSVNLHSTHPGASFGAWMDEADRRWDSSGVERPDYEHNEPPSKVQEPYPAPYDWFRKAFKGYNLRENQGFPYVLFNRLQDANRLLNQLNLTDHVYVSRQADEDAEYVFRVSPRHDSSRYAKRLTANQYDQLFEKQFGMLANLGMEVTKPARDYTGTLTTAIELPKTVVLKDWLKEHNVTVPVKYNKFADKHYPDTRFYIVSPDYLDGALG